MGINCGLLGLGDLHDANALEGIDRDSKLLDTGEFLQHDEIRPDFYHLVSQDLRATLNDGDFVSAASCISQLHRLTNMQH